MLGQLTIIVDELPANTPVEDPIHIAGDFQNWDPGNPQYMLTKNSDLDIHYITLESGLGAIEFKFTRGSWQKVESDEHGGFLPNRMYTGNEGDTIKLQIAGWEDVAFSTCEANSPLSDQSTAAENVEIFSDTFYMPQFDRCRRIWVYLPPDYQSSNRSYPVIYMHDGQNVFDATTSFAGEWRVDETLNQLFEGGDPGVIVVAVDNGQVFRSEEYIPWDNANFDGKGNLYAAFLVNTLKPAIDAAYRTKPEREYTAIMGSSFGGVISTYTGMEYQEVFSKIGSFSPSYWVSEQAFNQVQANGKQADMRMYQIMGSPEGQEAVDNMNRMEEVLHNAGFTDDEVISVEHPDGQHNEAYWAREFAAAYLWLFDQTLTSTNNIQPDSFLFEIFPNPSQGVLNINHNCATNCALRVYDTRGRLQIESTLKKEVDLTPLEVGIYYVHIQAENGDSQSKKLVLVQ